MAGTRGIQEVDERQKLIIEGNITVIAGSGALEFAVFYAKRQYRILDARMMTTIVGDAGEVITLELNDNTAVATFPIDTAAGTVTEMTFTLASGDPQVAAGEWLQLDVPASALAPQCFYQIELVAIDL